MLSVRPMQWPRKCLATAIDSGEIQPWFQPKLQLSTGRICGVEALARWHHPEHGLLLPADFIGGIERHRLMPELTECMFHLSLQAMRRLHDRGHRIAMSINLTWDWLADSERVSWVVQLVDSLSLPRSKVVLEITESTALTEQAAVVDNVIRLRMEGFAVALDDFGTGYNSMQLLREMPVSHVKLDRSLVDGAADDERAMRVLECLMTLAGHLGLVTVAEGVERIEDMTQLAALGCEQLQGYLIAKPMAEAELLDYLQSYFIDIRKPRRQHMKREAVPLIA